MSAPDAPYLQLLDLPRQRGVGPHVLEERGFEADPQVSLLPVAVFLEETDRRVRTRSALTGRLRRQELTASFSGLQTLTHMMWSSSQSMGLSL